MTILSDAPTGASFTVPKPTDAQRYEAAKAETAKCTAAYGLAVSSRDLAEQNEIPDEHRIAWGYADENTVHNARKALDRAKYDEEKAAERVGHFEDDVIDAAPIPAELAEARKRLSKLRDNQFTLLKSGTSDERHDNNYAMSVVAKEVAALESKHEAATLARVALAEPLPPGAELWPDPVNILDSYKPTPFDGSEFPPELTAYPLIASEHAGFDPTIASFAALGTAAAAIRDQIQITNYYGSGWINSPRLFAMIVGPSGASKSPGYKYSLEPLIDIQVAARKQYDKELAAYPEDAPPEGKPKRPRIVVNDTTLEALAKALGDNDRGILIANDEFSSFFGSMDRYQAGGSGGRDRSEYLRLYDGGYNSVERSRDGGSISVSNWGASILTCTTPAALQKISKHLHDDGFTQRFNVVFVTFQKIVRASSIAPAAKVRREDEQGKYARLIEALFRLEPGVHNGVCVLAPNALERFDDWRESNKADERTYSDSHPGFRLAPCQRSAILNAGGPRLSLRRHRNARGYERRRAIRSGRAPGIPRHVGNRDKVYAT